MFERLARLKKRMRDGEPSFGAWLTIPSLNVAEIMAGIGFDWIFIDGEHGPFDAGSLQTVLAAFNGSPSVPIVRVAENDPVRIGQALDLGAEGVIVPQVEDQDGARRAVEATRYPPKGNRGFGPRRASNYYRDIERYVAGANDHLLTIVQIESLRGVEAIEAIAGVEGVDAVFVGPMDLSGSAGVLRQTNHPTVSAAIQRVIQHCRAVGMPCCAGLCAPEIARAYGTALVLTGDDTSLLQANALRTLNSYRTGA